MKDKNVMLFLEGDEGGGYGGSETSVTEPSTRGLDVFDEGGEPETAPPQTSEVSSHHEPTTTVDARQLAAEFGHVIGQHFQPPPKEISVEEAKKLLNVWEPTKEWLAKYDNLATRDQAIAEQRDGLIKQADTIMRYRMSEMQQAMEARYSPVIQYMQQQEARAGEQRFNQVFPQLAQEGLRPLLFSVAQSLLASGARFRDEKHLFTTIAKGVESVIKVNNPQFSLDSSNGGGRGTAIPQQGKRTGPTTGSIPVTTPGAGGGGGQRAPGPPKTRGMAIFDP